MDGDARFGRGVGVAWPPRMTRCECAELSFDEVTRRMRERGESLEAVQARTGCGRLCTACVPDLLDHVAESARR
jgi:NAD(P)H-nitrite reductase large subunit